MRAVPAASTTPAARYGQSAAATERSRPTSEPTDQKRYRLSVSTSLSSTTVITDVNAAAVAVPASARVIGLAPPGPPAAIP